MSTLLSLRQALGVAVDELESVASDARAFKAKETQILDLEAQIGRLEAAQSRSARLAKPVGTGGGATDPNADPTKFASFGENLLAIARHYSRGVTDARLRAPAGMGETDPSGGGFPVQVDFAQSILTRAYDMGEINKRLFRLGISSNANGIKIPGIDEQSRATGSRWGGVQSYWVGEGDTATATKPKFRLIELDLKKLMAVWYVTDELMADAGALTGIANQAFAEELTFMIEDSTIHGTGAGQPLGILNAPVTITVPTEKGQATKTLLYQNLLNMWARMWARSRFDAVWFINQDVEPQLYAVNQVIGTAGVPVYLPPGGISEKPYATLFGRPVVPIEYCETLGTQGDIILADFSQYVMADKNAMQQASSIHVRFLTDEMTFRITYRVDGQPIWHTPLTPFKGTQTKSPFITLASR
jgi:HK97 family phage major capsid protein